jgi:hypothetical protein
VANEKDSVFVFVRMRWTCGLHKTLGIA